MFIDTIQLQVAAFFVSFEYALTLKIAGYTVADRVYKLG
jgi:hypothetical protein|tara:strand:+ start:429 stop:545 length:117 start_codon:yes stop_codon:yes gene_type:complete